MARRRLYNFYIDDDLANGLKAMKERTGAPEAETVRRALRAYLTRAGVITRTERKRVATRRRP